MNLTTMEPITRNHPQGANLRAAGDGISELDTQNIPQLDSPVQSPAGNRSTFTHEIAARALLRGYWPLPCYAGEKRSFRKWKLPAKSQVRADFAVSGYELGLVVIAGSRVGVLDIDNPIGHEDVDLHLQERLLRKVLPLLEQIGAPSEETPSGGRHFFIRLPADWKGVDRIPGAGLELIGATGANDFLKTYPTPGYTSSTLDWPPHPHELPDAPSELLELFATETEKPAAQETFTPPGPLDQLAAYKKLVPGLKKVSPGRYTGRCPLHNDAEPSFGISVDEGGRWHWRCFASCPGSTMVAGEKIHHSGDLADLRRLIAKLRAAGDRPDLDRVRQRLEALCPAGSLGRRVGLVVLEVIRRRGLSLDEPARVSYRTIAKTDETLDQVNQKGALVHQGRAIRQGREELRAAGVAVGESAPFGSYRKGSTTWDLSSVLLTAAPTLIPDREEEGVTSDPHTGTDVTSLGKSRGQGGGDCIGTDVTRSPEEVHPALAGAVRVSYEGMTCEQIRAARPKRQEGQSDDAWARALKDWQRAALAAHEAAGGVQ